MLNSEIYGWIVEYPEGTMWKTPSNKFFWATSGAAKNAFSCHWYPPFQKYPSYVERSKLLEEEKKKMKVVRVKLNAEPV